jgi:hypothetical protein
MLWPLALSRALSGKHRAPGLSIDIATHGDNRRQAAQMLENRGFADIAGVDDHCRTTRRLQRLGSKQTMRIGDDADQHAASARLLGRQRLQSVGELVELPIPGEQRCPAPRRLLIAQRRQRCRFVHGRDCAIEAKLLGL